MGLRQISGSHDYASDRPPAAAVGAVLRRRASLDGRLVEFGEADHAAAGALDAYECGPGGLGPFPDESADRRIRARAFGALQRSVERVLQRHELSNAVQKGGG